MKITSPVFKTGTRIPAKFTCTGNDVNPELKFEDVPKNAKSLVLIMDDPDAKEAVGKVWDHWIIFNMPVKTKRIDENSSSVPGTQGKNSWGKNEYGGPCPPKGTGVHHYNFMLYALDTKLDFSKSATKKDIQKAIKGHIVEKAKLLGTFSQ